MQAAVRELAEETGLSCADADMVRLGTVAPDPGIISGRVALFTALKCRGTLQVDPAEIGLSAVQLFNSAEIENEISAEHIQDAVTLLVLCRHRLFQAA